MPTKKSLEEMTKLELLEYARKAKYMLGRNWNELQGKDQEIMDLQARINELEKKLKGKE